METTARLYSLTYKESKTYLFALLFIVGNIVLPQLSHLIPGGGLMWLPIYFFTLIASYKYGLRVGLLTAILSPLINNLLFGMPPVDVLHIILTKSSLLAIAAASAARYFEKVSFWAILGVVISYQVIGTLVEWVMVKDLFVALQDFRIGVPGMLIQLFGGFALLKAIAKL
ncbi:ECF transporter S component [Dysgonomonas sp. ZJ709]|uniref:ECF transporter S component n=1 Tax=Dysgonomonas sp. ZJ709 TaxID=2709797 RepID=UPI0013ED0DAA|nr:ECF transporter S component [Dysgonomonas sp. ZJ709]